jgi:hypothetical protein
LAYNVTTPIERLVIENLWVRRVWGYGIGLQSADVASFSINGAFLEDCGHDAIDLKMTGGTPTSDNTLGRKLGIINNVHVDGFGQNTLDGAVKTGIDLRGYVMASNIYVYDLKRPGAANVVGIRFNADAGPEPTTGELRYGGQTCQLSNARVICTDPASNQSIAGTGLRDTSGLGRCIGMEIAAEDVNVVNYMCDGAHTGIELLTEGPGPHGVQSVALSNIRIKNGRGVGGTGAGIYWTGTTGVDGRVSGLSQLGPFHISDCDHGFEIQGTHLRGAGIIRDCTTGMYFKDQSTANATDLDVYFAGNADNVGPGSITYP